MRGRLALCLLGLLVLAAGCTALPASPETRGDPKPDIPSAPRQPKGFESPPVVNAANVIEAALYSSDLHQVEERVVSDGLSLHFVINTAGMGYFAAHNKAMLMVQLQEIRAIAKLGQASKSGAFLAAAGNAALSPLRGLKNMILHPFDSAVSLPKGMWHYMRTIGDSATGKRGQTEDPRRREFLGFSQVKRRLAFQLGISPYSSSRRLQRTLNDVAWSAYAGGMPLNVFTTLFPGRVDDGGPQNSMENKLLIRIRETTPGNLRAENRSALLALGADDSYVREFLRNTSYAPDRQTSLVVALGDLEDVGDCGRFLEPAAGASSELTAFMFQRMAWMLRGYHQNVTSLKSIDVAERLPVALTEDGTMVVCVPLDLLIWTQENAEIAQALSSFEPGGTTPTQRELWVPGTVSAQSRRELESRGWTVQEKSFIRLKTRY